MKGKAKFTIESGPPQMHGLGDTRLGLGPTDSSRFRGSKSPKGILWLSFFSRLELLLFFGAAQNENRAHLGRPLQRLPLPSSAL